MDLEHAKLAFDDLRALQLPHELPERGTTQLVGRALRSVRGAVGDAVSKTVQGAMTRAVNQLVRSAVRSKPAEPARGPAPRKRAAAKPRARRA